jgi:hypothetical protein
MPATISAGDTLLVVFKFYGSGYVVSWDNGFTQIARVNYYNYGICSCYKKADGTESGDIQVATHSTGMACTTHCFSIQDAADPTVRAPQATTAYGSPSRSPGPPSISPTGGSKDYMFLAHAYGPGYCQQYCTNYVDLQHGGYPDYYTPWICSRGATTATESPSGYYGSTRYNPWVAMTIAVHPPTSAAVEEGWGWMG